MFLLLFYFSFSDAVSVEEKTEEKKLVKSENYRHST